MYWLSSRWRQLAEHFEPGSVAAATNCGTCDNCMYAARVERQERLAEIDLGWAGRLLLLALCNAQSQKRGEAYTGCIDACSELVGWADVEQWVTRGRDPPDGRLCQVDEEMKQESMVGMVYGK